MQRLLASDAVPPNKQQELLRVTQALDPLRLLQQLEQLQKALFQHAVKPGVPSLSQEGSSTLPFSVKLVTSEQVPGLWHSWDCPLTAQKGAQKKVSTKWTAP